MKHAFSFSAEDFAKLQSHQDWEGNRKKLQEAINKYAEADKELERVCKELGIEKPEMWCLNGDAK